MGSRIDNDIPSGNPQARWHSRLVASQKGANAGNAKVRPEVSALVEFRQLNLLDERWALRGPFTAIFCRNVMIYFDKPTQYAVLRRLAALLEPGGLLFAGHSENFADSKDWLRACGRTVYERCD